jgi:hypothetical protein
MHLAALPQALKLSPPPGVCLGAGRSGPGSQTDPENRLNSHLSLKRALVLAATLAAPAMTLGQAPTAGPRLIGTVESASAGVLTLKLEAGGEAVVAVTPDTKLVRTAPGAKTLAGATVIKLEDLSPGDRILVRATPGADSTHYGATAVIAMKQADIAQAQQQSEQDWQHRGVSGVVKSIDANATPPSIVLGTARPGQTLTIKLTPTTIVRRYSPNSVKFADAKMSTVDQIHPGDQLRARGERSGDEVTAEEVVAGTFRNVAGTVASVDAASNTVTVTDLATKKPITLTLNGDTQARKLSPEMAQRIAARFKSGGAAAAPGVGAAAAPGGTANAAPTHPSAAPEQAGAQQQARGDLATLLQRAPAVTLADLKKGDAVMVVASQGTPGAATAITLLAGVEPLLESSSTASRDVFSASWNLGGNAAGAEAAQ